MHFSKNIPANIYETFSYLTESLLLLKNRLGWDEDQSYRVPGKTYPSQKVAVFDLSAAEPIQK